MIKIYLIVGAVVAAIIAGFLWRLDYLQAKNDELESKVSWYETALKNEKDLNIKQAANLDEANQRAQKNATEKQSILDETKKLRDCVANKSCGYVLRFQPIQVPATSSGDTGKAEPGINDTSCRFGSDFDAWVVELVESIRLNKQKIESLQADVLVRSNKNYCRIGE